MAYVTGKTLVEEVKQRPRLEPEKAIRMTLDLCSTVRVAHNLNIFHRDLKPDNIIVRDLEKADLVVVDFGLSFNKQEEPDEDGLTRTEERFRNQFLSLPEHSTLGGNRRDHRSDVAAVCGILYFCLTGHQPVILQDDLGLAPHRRRGFSLRDVLASHPKCQALEALLDRGFDIRINDRFQSIDELVERLMAMQSIEQNTIEDPLLVAREVAIDLRRRDRKTQLGEFSKFVQPHFQRMNERVHQFGQGLTMEGFMLGMSNFPTRHFPSDIDIVSGQLDFSLGLLAHEGLSRNVMIRIGARGNQLVLLRKIVRNPPVSRFVPVRGAGLIQGAEISPATLSELAEKALPWEQLVWFDPGHPPAESEFNEYADDSVCRAIRELQNDVPAVGTS